MTGPAWWPIAQLGQLGRNPRLRGISAWWLLAVALSIATGILNVKLGWNGIEVQLAGMAFDLADYLTWRATGMAAMSACPPCSASSQAFCSASPLFRSSPHTG